MTLKSKINEAKQNCLRNEDSKFLRKLIIEESKKLIQDLKTTDLKTITEQTKLSYEKPNNQNILQP